MKVLTVGEFKSKFSEVINQLLIGKEVGVTYGKSKKPIGVFVPYKSYKKKNKIKLGLLKGKASFKIKKGFKMTIDEFLNLKDTT
ncbi:prevent-host-death protein [Candidatus Woesebacteria bacterium RIFCSPHIGHO2_01_FULL_39_32]|uniref:Prevent-host-death family protein n=2 Tax=Candidatus Woeseibacteriota TaxID=1752722 RepID=A0A0G0PQN1_9BACT|nr:MAG: Prevent-host-death family protein [Candidatus Woesebacteria bacterium GW2011_GWA1_39_8]OGM04240.1 MAG: prevent-host-death protein [Candidatus Woesebacteria bacterium GWB1_37_5]OGM25271.1 MAG: prevent-host-death protein [Candidatus Woesebacteria bacterium RIFCSPHIGHO2_01_FULL_39_32]OGM37771.1 MAG: prevent-host-death protein [Candidatus Woesebacteria bacterium RIFCSPHIGHO2_12_FULL_38_11]OGM64802.1 MAG: prevent-host-death protein [Candidatus Woesebacteria bacterium RIFCSPLOWO2_01_FULL_39_2